MAKGDRAMKNKHLGSSFDDFLKEEGRHILAHDRGLSCVRSIAPVKPAAGRKSDALSC
jgi:hypothetical protein